MCPRDGNQSATRRQCHPPPQAPWTRRKVVEVTVYGPPVAHGIFTSFRGAAKRRTRNPDTGENFRIKIMPTRILSFDQLNLPVTPPFLDFFLPLNRSLRRVIAFKPHEPVDAVARSKSRCEFMLVFINSADQITGDAEIQRPIFTACEKVDVVGHGRSCAWGSGVRGRGLPSDRASRGSLGRAPE